MKHSALVYTLMVILAVLLFPQVTFANTDVEVSNNGDGSSNSVSVNSQSSGQSVTCINGNCTTTGGGSKSTVCVNGHCSTTDDGNVDYSSPDGHNQVHIHNNTGDNSVSVTQEPTAGNTAVSPTPSDTPVPTITPDPTITQMRNDINKHVKEEIDGIKEHMKDQNAAISTFIDQQVKALQDLFDHLF